MNKKMIRASALVALAVTGGVFTVQRDSNAQTPIVPLKYQIFGVSTMGTTCFGDCREGSYICCGR